MTRESDMAAQSMLMAAHGCLSNWHALLVHQQHGYSMAAHGCLNKWHASNSKPTWLFNGWWIGAHGCLSNWYAPVVICHGCSISVLLPEHSLVWRTISCNWQTILLSLLVNPIRQTFLYQYFTYKSLWLLFKLMIIFLNYHLSFDNNILLSIQEIRKVY